MTENIAAPDYVGLVRFLIQPFLEAPDSLKVDCEISSRSRVWVRLAFEDIDKGRVLG
ncbi:MAG: KH domain-containing protein, partial [Phormidesmis sp. CAN_BIN36]|nr:KH domain-containing protein [Phormidesmis sp. CAN_BIN36]